MSPAVTSRGRPKATAATRPSTPLSRVSLGPNLKPSLWWMGATFLPLLCHFLFYPVDGSKSVLPKGRHADALSKVDPHVLKALEHNLLDMFGIQNRPQPKRGVYIPPYMQELYNQHLQAGDLETGSVRPMNRRHPTYSANTIRSFVQEPTIYQAKNSQGDPDLAPEVHLWFNISALQLEESLRAAELRVLNTQANLTHDSKSMESVLPKYRLEVFDVLHPGGRRSEEPIKRLLDTRVLSASRSAWESLDVSPAINRWRADPQRNYGLIARLAVLDGTKSVSNSHLNHVRLKRSSRHMSREDKRWAIEQPILVTYSNDGKDKIAKKGKRNRRSSKNKNVKRERAKKRKNPRCRRKALYVDFQDVGWNDWIVAPPGYDAYFCTGECPSHLPEHLNATNHAIVQTLVNSVNSQAVPKPCCVPTELSPISMLYVDEYEKVTLKNYQDMVVEACGCR